MSLKNAKTLLERLKRDASLRAALSAEGRSRFDAPLGFVGIDGETGHGAWFHTRPFYRADREHGCRIVPMKTVDELKPLQQAQPGYFVAILKRLSHTNAPRVAPGGLDRVPWLTVEIGDDGEITVAIDANVRHPITLIDVREPLQSVSLRVGTDMYACTMPAELVVESSHDRCHLVLGCDLPRLWTAEHEFVLEKRKKRRIGQTILQLDIEPLPGSLDRFIVRAADSRSIDLRRLVGQPEQPPPNLVLHVVFDRTAIDAEWWTDAVLATTKSANETSETVTDHWNARLRRRTAEAISAFVSKANRVIELELWPFADVPRHAMSKSHLTLSEAGPAWNHVTCRDTNAFAEAMNTGNQCLWRYGLDYVDAVDEALSEVASSVERRRDVQHAVLIVGDSPPPPERVGDPLWKAVVERRQNNCRRSPLFLQTMARLRKSQTPVLWAFVRAIAIETDHEELVQRLHRVQERVASALRGVDGLIVSECYPDDLASTIIPLVRSNTLWDRRLQPPDRTTMGRGSSS